MKIVLKLGQKYKEFSLSEFYPYSFITDEYQSVSYNKNRLLFFLNY